MQRLVDEAEYVLAVLRGMRNEVSANPKLFDPDAQQRIDDAIARVSEVPELRARKVGEDLKAP